jgi:hypothetical protein
MQKVLIKSLLPLSLSMLLFLAGCGSDGDILVNEIGYSYYISSLTIKDRGAATSDIDIAQDCPEAGTTGAITKSTMTVTLTAGSEQEYDLWVYKIEVEFNLLSSSGEDGGEDISLPTKRFDLSALVPSGGSFTRDIDLLTVTEKEDYLERILDNTNIAADFQVHVKVYLTSTPTDPSETYSVTYDDTITIANFIDASYDTCYLAEE